MLHQKQKIIKAGFNLIEQKRILEEVGAVGVTEMQKISISSMITQGARNNTPLAKIKANITKKQRKYMGFTNEKIERLYNNAKKSQQKQQKEQRDNFKPMFTNKI